MRSDESDRWLDPFEKRSDGRYAGGQALLDPLVGVVSLLPLIGWIAIGGSLAYALTDDRDRFGIWHQAIRDAIIGTIFQAIYLLIAVAPTLL